MWRAAAAALGHSSPVAAENGALAAAALSSVLPSGGHAIVTEIVLKLKETFNSQ